MSHASGTPRVSVVMPAYEAAWCIGEAVASTRRQTFGDLELIVVDDGSTDATATSAIAAADGDPRVRVVRMPHGGIVRALTKGLTIARGGFVARMDADDTMLPERLGAQVAMLEARPDVGLVSSLVAFGGDQERARGYALHVDWLNGLLDPESIALNRFIESPVAHSSVMFRRELLDQFGGYREKGWPEDYDLWLRWLAAGVRFAKVPQTLLRWNDPPDRLSRQGQMYAEEAFYACKCHWLGQWMRANVEAGRAVLLWGAGRVTRRHFTALTEAGVPLKAYVDIDDRKIGRRIAGLPVLSPKQLPPPKKAFVIGGVGKRGARELIRSALVDRGYVEGVDFVMAA